MKWVIRIVGGLVAILLVCTVALLALGQRSNAGRIHASVEINATPQQLWPWLNEGDKLKQWVSWLVEVRDWNTPPGVGAKRAWKMKDENNGGAFMVIDAICKEYVEPSKLSVSISSGGAFDGEQTYQLTDLGNGHTRMDTTGTYHFAMKFAQLMEPLITPSAEKKMVGDMTRLKSLIEAAPATASR